jgi:hypothetical protein
VTIYSRTTRALHTGFLASALLLFTAALQAQATWPVKILEPTEPPEVRHSMVFGFDTALRAGHALVGAPATDGHGAAYVFSQQGGSLNWVQTQKLVAPDMAAGTFGDRIDLDADSALISDTTRNLVYYFRRPNPSSSPLPFRAIGILRGGTEFFGSTVLMEGCTGLIASGAHGLPQKKGYVHVYNRCPSFDRWVFRGSLSAPGGTPGDRFGYSIAIGGTHLLIGAPWAGNRAGAVYYYTYANGTWNFKQKLTQPVAFADNQFGSGVGFRGGFAAIGAPNTILGAHEGVVELYKLENGAWVHTGTLTTPPEAGSGGIAQWGARVQVTHNRLFVNAQPKYFYRMSGSLTVMRRTPDNRVTFENQFGPIEPDSTFAATFDADGQALLVGETTRRTGEFPGQQGGGASLYLMPP